ELATRGARPAALVGGARRQTSFHEQHAPEHRERSAGDADGERQRQPGFVAAVLRTNDRRRLEAFSSGTLAALLGRSALEALNSLPVCFDIRRGGRAPVK